MIPSNIYSSLVYFFIVCMCIYHIVNIIAKFFWSLRFMYVNAYHSSFSNFNLFTIWVSVQFSRSVVSDSLQPHGLQQARLPCPSPTLGAYSNSCPSHQWCHPTISSSVIPFSSHLQSFPASGSFPMSQFFPSGGLSNEASVSASVLPRIFRTDFL